MRLLSSYNFDYLRAVFSTLKLLPSLHIGNSKYNLCFPRRANVSMYITNRCNSRCVICNHWEQPDKYDISLVAIKNLLDSTTLNKEGVLIQGGEPLLHPNLEEIISLFKKYGIKNLVLLTNGLLTERLVDLVNKFKISNITISLDGIDSNYKLVRGVEGYENVIRSIDLLKGKTNLSVCFTINRWNTYEDFLAVKKICLERNIRLMVNIYSRMEYIGKSNEEVLIDKNFEKDINPYVKFYNSWVRGEIDIPCLAMRFLAVVRPNGDVTLCQCKNEIILGNLGQQKFDDIWNSEQVKRIQKKYRFCNDCWVASHRPFDMKFALLIKRLIPSDIAMKLVRAL